MAKDYFVSGTWNAICDICGFKFKASELKTDYRGLKVCPEDLDVRNPQDFVRLRTEKANVDWVRKEATDSFVGDNVDDSSLGEVTLGTKELG